jgi:UDP:flavonoid glycosyltransferase YjiC (YdhE family)
MIVLLPHCAFLSETSRMLSIGRALRARGETVRFATHGGPYEALLHEEGEEVDRLEPALSSERCARFVAEVPGMGGRPKGPFSVEELRAMAAAEARYLGAQRAEAVVTGFTLSALLSSRVAKIPLITEHAGSFVPPMMEAGLVGAPLRSPVPFVRWLPRPLRAWFANQGPRRVKDFCTELNVVARELGVEEVPSLAAMLMGDLTLVTDVPELTGLSREDLEGWTPKTPSAYRAGPRMTYTGPLFARLDRPVPEHVARFLEDEGPVVYVAITSSTAAFVESVVRAVAASGARVLVAGTVHDLAALSSERVCVGGVLPSHEIFGRVALGVVAGGQQPARAAARRARGWLDGIDGAANAADAMLEARPPMTTVASGCCTSLPAEVDIAIGAKPSAATVAVSSSGCSTATAPSTSARSRVCALGHAPPDLARPSRRR